MDTSGGGYDMSNPSKNYYSPPIIIRESTGPAQLESTWSWRR